MMWGWGWLSGRFNSRLRLRRAKRDGVRKLGIRRRIGLTKRPTIRPRTLDSGSD